MGVIVQLPTASFPDIVHGRGTGGKTWYRLASLGEQNVLWQMYIKHTI